MSVASASRFAVLKLEDEDSPTPVIKIEKSPNRGSQESKQTAEAKTKTKKKKKKNSQDDSDLQNLAFGVSKVPKSKTNQSRQTSGQSADGKQWEEWKKKDAKFVTEVYEHDLQQALLLSKIDFEEKKEVYDAIQKETESSKGSNQKKKNKGSQKKDKPVPMTLEDFQNLPSDSNPGVTKKTTEIPEKNSPLPDESNFFDKLEEDVENIIHKENRKDAYQRIEAYRDDQLRNIQYKDELEKKDQEIARLNEEISRLKLEVKALKDRKKLMSKLLFEGEMHDKAAILIQIDQITKVKDELTEQVTELHASLEQERSKVHSLTTELKKYQNKKKDKENK